MTDLAPGAVRKVSSHIFEREENEHYVEPAWCSKRLFEEEQFEDPIWDPACGFGTIVKSAVKCGYDAYGSDLVDRGFSKILGNFLTCDPVDKGSIVTNPPFNLTEEFARQAVFLVNKSALIFPTARLHAAHWIRQLPLRRVWLMSPRPSMPPGHYIAAGNKPGGGKADYCWIVFDRGFVGKPELRWLYRDKK